MNVLWVLFRSKFNMAVLLLFVGFLLLRRPENDSSPVVKDTTTFTVDNRGCGCQHGSRNCQKVKFLDFLKKFDVPEASCVVIQNDLKVYNHFVSSEWKEIFQGLRHIRAYRPMKKRRSGVPLNDWFRSHCVSNNLPDAIIFSEPGSPLSADTSATEDKSWSVMARDVPIFVLIDDVHYHNTPAGLRYYLALKRATEVLSPYVYMVPYWYRGIPKEKCTWVPHCAGEKFLFLPLNSSAKSDVLITGQLVPEWYPCRFSASKLADGNRISLQPHPDPHYRGLRIKRHYSSVVQEHMFSLATSYNGYVVPKIFEIPATGSAVVIDHQIWNLLRVLGFEENENYFGFDCDMALGQKSKPQGCSAFSAVVDRLLTKDMTKTVEKVRRGGMKLIHEKHTVYHRIWQITSRVMATIERRWRLKGRNIISDHYLGSVPDHDLNRTGKCFEPSEPFLHEWPPFLEKIKFR